VCNTQPTEIVYVLQFSVKDVPVSHCRLCSNTVAGMTICSVSLCIWYSSQQLQKMPLSYKQVVANGSRTLTAFSYNSEHLQAGYPERRRDMFFNSMVNYKCKDQSDECLANSFCSCPFKPVRRHWNRFQIQSTYKHAHVIVLSSRWIWLTTVLAVASVSLSFNITQSACIWSLLWIIQNDSKIDTAT